MRMNPFQMAKDWSKKKASKEFLLKAIKQQRPGQGIEVPSVGDDAPIWAAALMDLLKEHPELTVVRMASTMTLCKRAQIKAHLSPGMHSALQESGAIAEPGDNLQ